MSAHTNKLSILFGVPETTARGGINACEPPFIKAVRDTGVAVEEEIYLFDNREGTSLMKRVSQVLSTAARFARLARSRRFDIIHLNTSFEKRSLLRDSFTVFRIGKQKVFLKFHGSDLGLLSSQNPLVRMLVSYVTGKASAMGVLSSEEKRAFVAAGIPANKVFVVRNAVKAVTFPHVEKNELGPKKLLFVSRLVKTKGLEDTVRAVKSLVDSGRDLTLDVLGTGEAKAPAERLADRLGIGSKVRFHGHVDEEKVRAFQLASDILVFPTFHDEGFPMVIFGALSSGIPIVTTEIRAAADYLKDGENCVFCKAHDPESVASSIEKILDHGELAHRIRENNRKLGEAFLPERIASEYLGVYGGLTGTDKE